MEIRDAALEYANKGWRVLPLHTVVDGSCSCGNKSCGNPGKHPRNHNGSSGASNDLKQVSDWWYLWPDANVGIATGPESGLVVVDVDGAAGRDSLATLDLPFSSIVETGGGGLHIYYSWPKDGVVTNSVRKIADGIDVRGAGGYVVAPPSVHAKGSYSWKNSEGIIPAPDLIVSQKPVQEAPLRVEGNILTGARNDTLAKLAGAMQRVGFSEDAIYDALSKTNQERCVPTLGDDEVRRIAHSIHRYNPGDPVVYDHTRLPEIKVYRADELRALDIPDQDELVGPLLVRGSRLVVAGHTGEGKTTFALQLLHSAITGSEFLHWKGQGSARVLVLDAEQGLRTIQRRLDEADFKGQYPHIIRVPDGINLDNPHEAAIIEEVIAKGEYDIVCLDPLYKLHKGEITDERVSVELMRRLDAWREHYKFGLLLLAHCRKPSPGFPFTIHDVFGSTAVLRGAEVVLGLQRVESGSSVIHFFKDRDGDLPVGDAEELAFTREKGFRPRLRKPEVVTPPDTWVW